MKKKIKTTKINPIHVIVSHLLTRGMIGEISENQKKLFDCTNLLTKSKFKISPEAKEEYEVEIEICYDPKVKKQFERRERCSHDSTLIFTQDLLLNTVGPLTRGERYYKPNGEPDFTKLKKIKYTIGDIKLTTEHKDKVKLRAGVFPGVAQTTKMPVRVEYEYKE